jgi:hypothetical protein
MYFKIIYLTYLCTQMNKIIILAKFYNMRWWFSLLRWNIALFYFFRCYIPKSGINPIICFWFLFYSEWYWESFRAFHISVSFIWAAIWFTDIICSDVSVSAIFILSEAFFLLKFSRAYTVIFVALSLFVKLFVLWLFLFLRIVESIS